MWTVQLCEKILNSKKYIHLCEKRLCPLHGKQFYLNAFEFGVFASKKLCVKLSHAMHALGFLSSDMLTPFIVSLATVKLYTSNYYTLACIHWNKETVLGMLKRPDSDIIPQTYIGRTPVVMTRIAFEYHPLILKGLISGRFHKKSAIRHVRSEKPIRHYSESYYCPGYSPYI